MDFSLVDRANRNSLAHGILTIFRTHTLHTQAPRRWKMVVRTQDRRPGHSGAVGLHIGTLNAQQYFARDLQHIELELDHLRIACTLDASFWQDRPEIHDQRLSCWLESKRTSGKLAMQAAPVAMIPCGRDSFRLQMMSAEEADPAFSSPPSPAYFSPTVAPAVLLDRRKHSSNRGGLSSSERRRIARLKGNDLASASAND